jgi:hypothetical protein
MSHLGFTSLRPDPDVWFRPLKQATGEDYYKYVLLYIDDVLVISERADKVLCNKIGQHFVLREESIGPPSIYLGGKLRKITLEDGVKAWVFGSCQYIRSTVKNVEEHLAKTGEKLPYKAPTLLSSNYRPEIDVSPELGEIKASHFHSLIGVLRWIVELGRVDLDVELKYL